jgi:mRNA interferase YafQ
MRAVEFTSRFYRDYKREKRNPNNRDLQLRLEALIEILAMDENLPARFEDHALVGKFVDHRSCHLKPDLIVIYVKEGSEVLRLVRLGSHSNLY